MLQLGLEPMLEDLSRFQFQHLNHLAIALYLTIQGTLPTPIFQSDGNFILKKQGTLWFEPAISPSAVECSTIELYPNMKESCRAGKMDFKVGGAMEHWKVLSDTMAGWQERFSNSRCSRMANTIIFWPWWQPFNSFCFETLSFLPLSPFFLFAMPKSRGAMPAPPVSPALSWSSSMRMADIVLSGWVLHFALTSLKCTDLSWMGHHWELHGPDPILRYWSSSTRNGMWAAWVKTWNPNHQTMWKMAAWTKLAQPKTPVDNTALTRYPSTKIKLATMKTDKAVSSMICIELLYLLSILECQCPLLLSITKLWVISLFACCINGSVVEFLPVNVYDFWQDVLGEHKSVSVGLIWVRSLAMSRYFHIRHNQSVLLPTNSTSRGHGSSISKKWFVPRQFQWSAAYEVTTYAYKTTTEV